MPPEVRNHIYDLTLTSPASTVDLMEAAPPSKDLIMACREIYDETRHMHQAAYHLLRVAVIERNNEQIRKLNEHDIANITQMTIRGLCTWKLENGIWHAPTSAVHTHYALGYFMPTDREKDMLRKSGKFVPKLMLEEKRWVIADERREDVRDISKQHRSPGLSTAEIMMMMAIAAEIDNPEEAAAVNSWTN